MAAKPKVRASPAVAPSKGTQLAAEIRAVANKLTDAQRQALRLRGLQLIYHGGHEPAVAVNRR